MTYDFEGFGRVGTFDLEDEPYQFYMLDVLKGADGYYISTDSGCSCPMPFESHTIEDYTGPLTAEQVIEEYDNLLTVDGRHSYFAGEAARLKEDLNA